MTETRHKKGMVLEVAGTRQSDVRIVGRSAVREIGDRLEIEWQLNVKPELEWAEVFQMAVPSDRQGSPEWVEGGGPDVIGATIRWFVPSGEVEHADAEVQHRVSVTNERLGLGQEQ